MKRWLATLAVVMALSSSPAKAVDDACGAYLCSTFMSIAECGFVVKAMWKRVAKLKPPIPPWQQCVVEMADLPGMTPELASLATFAGPGRNYSMIEESASLVYAKMWDPAKGGRWVAIPDCSIPPRIIDLKAPGDLTKEDLAPINGGPPWFAVARMTMVATLADGIQYGDKYYINNDDNPLRYDRGDYGRDIDTGVIYPAGEYDALTDTIIPTVKGPCAVIPASAEQPLPVIARDGNWDNTVLPPALANPLHIQIGVDSPVTRINDFDSVGCDGLIHLYRIPAGRDALVTMAPGSSALKYPVYVYGGRNVILRGLEMRTVVQPGCAVGESHQVRSRHRNIHPRLPGGKVFRLEQSGTTFVEGVDIDLAGQEADCMVMRNPSSMSIAQALTSRHFAVVNSRCTGIEGLDESPIGNGIHGDFFQNQGTDNLATFQVENVSFRTSSNGITLHRWNGKIPSLFRLRNMDYGWDTRYSSDDRYEISGLAYSGHGQRVQFEGVYLNHPKGGNYGFINGERVGAISRKNGYIKKVAGVYEGTPPGGDFASVSNTGLEYVSPYRSGAE